MDVPMLDAIVIDRDAAHTLQQQLCVEVKRLIHAGTLRPGQPVPSSRSLASDLDLSRNTVTAAYDRLIGDGYLEARPRSGLFVTSALDAPAIARVRRRTAATPLDPGPAEPLRQQPRPFRPCQPDVRLFPLRVWNRLRGRVLRANGAGLLMYQSEHVLGLPALRQVLAAYLRESRGVRCDWRQVAITSGSQQALYLLAQLLIDRGAPAVVEDPGYPGAVHAWASRGARVEPAPVDDQGASVPDRIERLAPSVIYLTPSRQFPTGACLPVARRLAWLASAGRTGAWLIEDDYDSEFRYGRAPMPSLHSLDTAQRVIYVGSMSKVLFPSMRIGFAVLPPALVDRFAALRAVVDDHGPLIDQATLAAFIECGAFATHIRRCRRQYGERQQAFLAAARRCGIPLTFAHIDGGMNLLGALPAGSDDAALSRRLAAAGFDVPPLSAYSQRRVSPGLVFGYAAYTAAEQQREVARLARVLRDPSGTAYSSSTSTPCTTPVADSRMVRKRRPSALVTR